MAAFFGMVPPLQTQTRWTYWGTDVQNIPAGIMPPILNRSYSITVEATISDADAEGVLLAAFDHLGGFALFVQDGLLRHTYSFMGVETYRHVADEALPTGEVTIVLDVEADAAVMAPACTVTLSVNGVSIGGGRMERTVPIMFNAYSGLDIGRDNGEVVDPSYAHLAPFPFSGTIHRIDVDVRRPGEVADASIHHAETAGLHARHIES